MSAESDARTTRLMNRQINATLKAMRQLEKDFGHHGVFVAIREWLNKPYRGQAWAFRRRKQP